MRVLDVTDAGSLAAAIDSGDRCDYVYMYPPRQAYRPLPKTDDTLGLVRNSLRDAEAVNLYFHFPFCRQICTYCNLYAVASRNTDTHARYRDAVIAEIDMREADLVGKAVRTVYFGGGTPSMLEPELLGDVLHHAAKRFGFDLETIREVALEVAPDTATPDRLRALRDIGFNRINLGVQSSEIDELTAAGRRYQHGLVDAALDAALTSGFANVCVDLIFGLEHQTFDSWRRSVEFVLDRRPETICAYALTLRPGTGFARRGYTDVDGHEQYRRWDHVNTRVLAAGYERQTHVRWALPGRGGYLQKEYHWASEALVGFGAGARSYLHAIDTRNGYSLRRRASALEHYLTSVEAAESAVTDGFVMDDDERMRKKLVLGLQRLDLTECSKEFGRDPTEVFGPALDALHELGLVVIADGLLRLTDKGFRYRDLAVQPFLSERVRRLVRPFAYVE